MTTDNSDNMQAITALNALLTKLEELHAIGGIDGRVYRRFRKEIREGSGGIWEEAVAAREAEVARGAAVWAAKQLEAECELDEILKGPSQPWPEAAEYQMKQAAIKAAEKK